MTVLSYYFGNNGRTPYVHYMLLLGIPAFLGQLIAAGWSGKVKTASTMVCICLMLFGIPHWLNLVCQGVILVTTVYSGVEYFAKNWDVFQEKK